MGRESRAHASPPPIGTIGILSMELGRYTAFAHGRDTIRRFGAPLVAATLERAWGPEK